MKGRVPEEERHGQPRFSFPLVADRLTLLVPIHSLGKRTSLEALRATCRLRQNAARGLSGRRFWSREAFMSLCKGGARARKFWMWVTIEAVSKGLRTGSQFLLGLAVACFVLVGISATAQTKARTTDQSERLIDSVRGPDLFRAHCAGCHGLEGKGDGPAGLALKKIGRAHV
jgi:hypothetical protein